MKLNILVDNGAPISGNVVDTVDSVAIVPPVGTTITTENGIYVVIELGIDYAKNEINAWVDPSYDEL